MKKAFNEKFKKDFLNVQKGENWNRLKEKYNVSEFHWDNEMKEHFEKLLGRYSSYEDYRKKNNASRKKDKK